MRMPQRVHTQRGHEVEILLPFEVVEKNTFAALKANGIPVVGGEKKALFKIGDLIGAGRGVIAKPTAGGTRVYRPAAPPPREPLKFPYSPPTSAAPRCFSPSNPPSLPPHP